MNAKLPAAREVTIAEARELEKIYPYRPADDGACLAEARGSENPYYCTRPHGHTGPHVAHFPKGIAATWDAAPAALPIAPAGRIYPRGTRISEPDDRGGYVVWELVGVAKSWPCVKCGGAVGGRGRMGWAKHNANGRRVHAGRRCDSCRPAGVAVQPDGFTERTK